MKTSIKSCAAVILLIFVSFSAVAQKSCNSNNTTRNITLDGSSDTENIKLEVADNVKDLHLGINSTISSGYLTVEIYDPKGGKQGYFSVESQMSSGAKKKEEVCGQMNKQINEPMKGEWTVKLIPKNVKGKISIMSHQMQ